MKNNMFPVITRIEPILAAIEGRPEFIVAERDGYTVVNYNVAHPDTFPPIYDAHGVWDEKAALLRECRGIMFDLDGYLISRPYNKFFNMNQIPETQSGYIDLSQPHVILDKLDGSMVRAVLINGEIRLCTKMGLTDEAKMAEEFVEKVENKRYKKFCDDIVGYGMTPIFEFCSRRNQIILDYPEDKLVLTAIRFNDNGHYVSRNVMSDLAKIYGIPVVEIVDVAEVTDIKSLDAASIVTDAVRNWRNVEGIVIRFDSGYMVKVKCEEYCIKHHAKDSLLLEKNLIKLHLEEKLDDVLPLLDDAFRARVDEYISAVEKGIKRSVEMIESDLCVIYSSIGFNRSKQAEFINSAYPNPVRGLMFAGLDGKDVRETVIKKILLNVSSGPKLDTVRSLFNASWV